MRFGSGFIVGFFLATLLAFSLVQVSLGPYYEDLKTVRPYVEAAYNVTHSELYWDIQDFVVFMGDAAPLISSIPFIGSSVDTSEFQEYSRELVELMEATASISEKTPPLLDFALSVIEVTPFAIALSFIMVLAGFGLYTFSLLREKEAPPPTRTEPSPGSREPAPGRRPPARKPRGSAPRSGRAQNAATGGRKARPAPGRGKGAPRAGA